jgi:hypothetical protein
MFKNLSSLGGITPRCRFTTLMLMALVAITFSSVAQAQHGVSINKGCASPVRICNTDAECVDANQCTDDVCLEFIPDMLDCEFTVTPNDAFNDTLSINGAWDVVFHNGGPTRVPAVGDSAILSAGGNTTCVPGPFVPCTIGPDLGTGAGSVTFISTGYSPTAADPNPLQDQATVLVVDLCDGIPTPDCFPGINNPISFGAATILVDGCDNPIIPDCEPIGCQSDVECDDGLFCNGTETCDVVTGNCVAVSACPPAIDGCVIRNSICDEDNDVCIDEIDDSLCQEGEVCMPPEGPCVVPCDFDPSTQKYWHSQCLALPASEGGIDHKGRGPKGVKEPGFVEVLIPCAEQYLEDVGLFEVTSCEGMDANPPSDDCERAIKQLTALILNVCSDRLPLDCPVCIADTCANALPEGSDVQGLIDGVAEYILAGMCKEAAELAALANDGEAICVLDP